MNSNSNNNNNKSVQERECFTWKNAHCEAWHKCSHATLTTPSSSELAWPSCSFSLELAPPNHSLQFGTGATLTQLEGTPSLHKRLPSTCPDKDVRQYKITFESWLWSLLATAKFNTVLARTRTPLLYVVYKRIYDGEKPWRNESEIIYRTKLTNFQVLILFS